MTIQIDPNAQHAVYAPSSAHRWTVCTASAEAIARLPEQEEGEEAAKGTAAHEEIERCMAMTEGVADWRTLVDGEHPSAFGVALVLNYVQQLQTAFPGQLWVEQRVALTPQIWGRCDVAHWDDKNSVLTIVDYKDGFVGVDAEKNEQLRIYAAASMFTHNLPVKWVRYAVVQPNDFRPVPRVKQWNESAEALYTWASDTALIPTRPKSFVAGPEQCTYCPLFGLCDASKDMLTSAGVGPIIAGLMRPDQIRPEQRALFMACQKPITDAFKNADKPWLKEALAGSAPVGMKIVETRPHRTWHDENAAKQAVFAVKGIDGLSPPTPAQAETMGIDVSTLAYTPKGVPALAFENDKRKTWKRPSALDMFAGIVTVTKTQ